MAFGTPPAYMGFVGFVRFEFPADKLVVRATSADVRLSQDITKPDVIDGRYDRSVYQLGPKIVEGSVEYPAIMTDTDPAARLYRACVGRESSGERFGQLKNSNLFDLGVRYTSQFAEFRYKDCLVNQWKFSAAQSDTVKINCDLLGKSREKDSNIGNMTEGADGFPRNSRIVTWNDVVVNIKAGDDLNISGEYIRNFECSINNNAERYYSFNGLLEPQDIAVKKRDIDGSMTLLGRHPALGEYAETNQQRCSEDSEVQFGYNLTTGECDSTFLVTLPNIVFRIEELALTNDLFETTVQWHAFPDVLDLDSSTYLTT